MNTSLRDTTKSMLDKVPAVTLAFWIVMIQCTTIGETAADFLAVDASLGQGVTRIGLFVLLAEILVS